MEQFESSNTKGDSPTKRQHKPKSKARSYCFTYNNYDDGTLVQSICQSKYSSNLYVYQEEMGKNGTKHLQGVIRFPNPVGYAFQSDFPKEIHWERCRSWPKSIKYCCKADTRCGKVWTNIKDLKIPKKPIDYFAKHKPYEWQSEILKLIKQEPDERTVYWYWEPKGRSGKSSLARHIVLNYNAIVISGGSRDIKCGITDWINNDKRLDIVIIDIPRSAFNNVSYKAIEEIKNGMFYNTKYESQMCVFDIPHVIVFANYKPRMNMMSIDRWSVSRISYDITRDTIDDSSDINKHALEFACVDEHCDID